MQYVPEFTGEIEGYVVNFLTREHWRVRSTVPREDCIQEAACVFLKCRRRYADIVTEPAHFMALFKTAWSRKFTDLANENTLHRRVVSIAGKDRGSDMNKEDNLVADRVGDLDNDGRLGVLLRQAPREVAMVVSLFLGAPQELLEIALASWRHGDRRTRALGSRRVNQMLGLPEDRDTMSEVMDYFAP